MVDESSGELVVSQTLRDAFLRFHDLIGCTRGHGSTKGKKGSLLRMGGVACAAGTLRRSELGFLFLGG